MISKPTEDNSSKTCIDDGDINGTRDTHFIEEISIVIPEGSRIFSRGTLCVHLMSSNMMTVNIIGISEGFSLA